jgi:8-oxo-dGTP pyrophosphatase MutT (NUDIX family)
MEGVGMKWTDAEWAEIQAEIRRNYRGAVDDVHAQRPEAPAKNGPCSVCGDSDGKGYCPIHRPEAPAPPIADSPAKTLPRLVVCAIIIRNDKVLLEKRAPAGIPGLDNYWDLPGGKVECEEEPEAAIKREINEELAITIKPLTMIPYLPISTWVYTGGERRHWILAAYLCEITGGEPLVGTDLQWFDVDNLPADTLCADRRLINMAKQAPPPRGYQHHVLCSADRRFPAGDPGHGCVCFEIKPPTPTPTERTFTAEQVYEAAQAAHTACGFTCEWRYFLNSMMDHLVPPKPKTPEERVAAILRRHLSANTNSYHDAIAAEIVAELAKEQA